jgi:hypothetical protein
MIPLYLMPLLMLGARFIPGAGARILGIPVFDFAGMTSRVLPGVGLGIFAVGGLSFGVVAAGGCAIGLIAMGGGAVGVLAFGGGAVGVIAIGGGAVGYIALGGGAYGHFALGNRAHGKYVLAINRQDPEAVEFFVRYIPRLREAVTNPMPVILLEKSDQPQINPDERG